MNTQTPCSDYVETSGIIFFARMLDKVRLNAQGLQTKAAPPNMPPGGDAVDAHSIGRDARPALHLWKNVAARVAGGVALLRERNPTRHTRGNASPTCSTR